MNTPSLTLAGIIAALGVASLGSVQAATTVLLNENFDTYSTVADVNAAGWYFRNTSSSGALWGDPQTLNEAPLSGMTLHHGGGSTGNTWVLKQWSGTTLTSLGDSLTLSFDAVLGSGNEFDVGLLDASQTLSGNALGGASPIAGATGYGYVQTASTAGVVGIISGSGTTSSSTDPSTSSNDLNTFLDTLSTLPSITGTALSFSLVITKVATGAQVDFYQGSTLLSSSIDTSATDSLTFNTIKLRAFNNSNLDNVVLTYATAAVPEPSTAACFTGIVTLCLALVRRRRGYTV